jgi:hypothetical protein
MLFSKCVLFQHKYNNDPLLDVNVDARGSFAGSSVVHVSNRAGWVMGMSIPLIITQISSKNALQARPNWTQTGFIVMTSLGKSLADTIRYPGIL